MTEHQKKEGHPAPVTQMTGIELLRGEVEKLCTRGQSEAGELVSRSSILALIDLMPRATHPDDLAVDRFAAAMKAKLAKKRDQGRGGWENKDECSQELLSGLLRDHVDKGDPVDVGNLAMMLSQRGETILPDHEPALARAQLNAIVDAWEALPGGRHVRNSDVEEWLADDMAPAINTIRGFLQRPRPDGVIPPSPQTKLRGITPADNSGDNGEKP